MRKNKFKSFIMIWFVLAFASLVSADVLLQPSVINTNKSINQDVIFQINITNPDSFSYFNVQFEDNDFIRISEIGELPAGASVFVDSTIFSNQDANVQVKLKAFKNVTIGQSNQTYLKNVNNHRVEGCETGLMDESIIQGDIITFKNDEPQDGFDIEVVGDYGSTNLMPGEEVSLPFNTPGQITLHFLIEGVLEIDSGPCTIDVQDDSGLVKTQSNEINLILDVSDIPTTISASVFDDFYTMNYDGSVIGTIHIQNTGNNEVFNVNLAGEWIQFNDNDFNIPVGESRDILYTIRPEITTTGQTNKTYNKSLTITGNFETQIINFSIFINFADLDGGGGGGSNQSLAELLEQYCLSHPDICKLEPEIIYIDPNNTDQEFNVTMSVRQVREMFKYLLGLGDILETTENFQRESTDSINNRIANIEDYQVQINQTIIENQRSREQTSTLLIIVIFGFLAVVSLAVTGGLIFYYKKQQKSIQHERWGGEVQGG